MKSRSQLVIKVAITALVLLMGVTILAMVRPNMAMVEAQPIVPALQPSQVNAPATGGPRAEAITARTITVVGEGRVNMKPDIAQINIGIDVVADTVRGASSEATNTMKAVMASLQAQGITEKDMQTSGYNIWVERPYGSESPINDNILYHVGNSVAVTIRDLDTVGAVLDGAIEAGANNIHGVTFSVANHSQLMTEARAKAVTDALSKANELADMNQVTLSNVVSVSEVIGTGGGYYSGGLRALPVAEGMGGAGPISPGELEMSVQLQVTYSIQ
jgi:uncharacterized protein YggE